MLQAAHGYESSEVKLPSLCYTDDRVSYVPVKFQAFASSSQVK